MVVALADTGEALYWGEGKDDVVYATPQTVEGYSCPREVVTLGSRLDSGGTVYLGKTTVQCRHKTRSILYQIITKETPYSGRDTQAGKYGEYLCIQTLIYILPPENSMKICSYVSP